MGNQVASGNPSEPGFYGGIFAKLDNETFTPGDTLTGTVYLNLNNQYPGDKICMAVKGVEYVKWIDRVAHQRNKPDGTMETYYEEVPREASIDIIKQEMDVYDWQRGAIVPRGQYTFPFQFTVPQGLPGSFFFRRGTALAEIKYSVEAFLKPEKENIPKLSHKVPVTVRENPKLQIQTNEVAISKSLTTWCCFNQGTCSMRTAFEKNAYAPNEEARIITEVDNSQCSLGIPNVRFSLMQSIQLVAGPHRTGFSFVIRSTSLGRIEAGQACLGNDRKEASILLPPGIEGRAKDFTGTEGYEPDPSTVITPSTHGRLVKSDFNLQVVCETEGCLCCDSAPVNTLPILVYAPVIKRAADPTPPPNWQPQQMPAANLTITIINAPSTTVGITIPVNNGNGMVGNQMPQQNFNQPNQAPQMNQMSSPQQQPQFQQQQQPQFQQQQQPQFQQQQQPQFQQQQQYQQQPQYQQQQQQQPQFQQQPQYQQQPQSIQPQMVQVGGYNQNQNQNNMQYR